MVRSDVRPVLYLANAPSWIGPGWPWCWFQSSDRSWGLVANLETRDPEESGADPEMKYKVLLLFSAMKDVSLLFKYDRRMRQQPGMLMRQYPLYQRSAIAELVKCCGDTMVSARDGQKYIGMSHVDPSESGKTKVPSIEAGLGVNRIKQDKDVVL
jgi:hypothetical protein